MKRLALALLFLPLIAFAEVEGVVLLKGGGRLEGRITETPEGVTVSGRFGTMSLRPSQVESIRRQALSPDPPAPPPEARTEWSPPASRDAASSVLRLSVFDASGREKGRGSAFVASPEGHLVTNRHVVAGAHRALAVSPDGSRHEVLGVLAEDAASDLVVLRIAGDALDPLPLGPESPPDAGTRASSIGYPHGGEQSVSSGELSAVRALPDGRAWIPFSGDAVPGSSGSPILDGRGEVVGVLKGERVGKGERSAYVIPVARVRALLDAAGSRPRPLALVEPLEEDVLCADPLWKQYVEAVREGDAAARLALARALVRGHPESAAARRLLEDCGR